MAPQYDKKNTKAKLTHAMLKQTAVLQLGIGISSGVICTTDRSSQCAYLKMFLEYSGIVNYVWLMRPAYWSFRLQI